MAAERATVDAFCSATAHSVPVCASKMTSTHGAATSQACPIRTSTHSRAGSSLSHRQACSASSYLRAGKKILGTGLVGHSSFRLGLPLRRRGERRLSNGSRWSAAWLDNTVQVETDVPISEAWDLWSDREGVYRWMPWIDNVKVLEDQPELSRWTLKYNAFGQSFEFSWIARNMKPVFHQKIHWRSVDGLPNKGTVRFYPRTPSSCAVQLTISYEVPEVLAGLASGLSPLVESILQQDLDRFAKFAKKNQLESQRK